MAQGTTLLKVNYAATLAEMETIRAENALLAGHNKLKKVILGFMLFSRWAIVFRHCRWALTRWHNQTGVARSAEEILSDVKSQVKLACLGVAQNVQSHQTKTGIKDAYMQF